MVHMLTTLTHHQPSHLRQRQEVERFYHSLAADINLIRIMQLTYLLLFSACCSCITMTDSSLLSCDSTANAAGGIMASTEYRGGCNSFELGNDDRNYRDHDVDIHAGGPEMDCMITN